MRFHSAMLLFSSISGLLSLDVLAAPIRIVVVEKVAISEADAFLRSVRIGHPAGANPIPGVEDVGGQPIRLSALTSSGDGLLHIAKPAVNPSAAIPMTPDAEFNILPFPHPNFGESYEQSMREFCEMESQRWKARFHRMSNWLREMLGLPPIRDLFNPCPTGILDIPIPVTQDTAVSPPSTFGLEKPCHSNYNGGDTFSGNALEVAGPRRRPGMWAARHRPKTFLGRLRRALYSLTPWEGRALAFVVGCGLGVLIRMVYVFIVLGARALRCRNQSSLGEEEDDEEPEQVVEGVILFDAGSIKAASEEDLPLYNEKDY